MKHYEPAPSLSTTGNLKYDREGKRESSIPSTVLLDSARRDCFKALKCLYIAVENSIADDVNAKVKAYITLLESNAEGDRT